MSRRTWESLRFGNISVDGIQQILTDSATKLSINHLGAGVVNGGLAVQMAKYSLFKDAKENLKAVAATSTSGNLKLTWDDGAAFPKDISFTVLQVKVVPIRQSKR